MDRGKFEIASKSESREQETADRPNSEQEAQDCTSEIDQDKLIEGEKQSLFRKNKEISSKQPRIPESNGIWLGEKGDSAWLPDLDYTPPEKSKNLDKPYSNPENLKWGEILNKYGIEYIEFENRYPVFDDVAKAEIQIDGFEPGGSDAKVRNFAKADRVLAEQYGCDVGRVIDWRKENNYTWHECEDRKTMQLVPNEIHANVPHEGGRAH